MAKTFAYKAKDRAGRLMAGTILAENEAAVATFIRDKGYYVTQIKTQQEQNFFISFLGNLQQVSTKELAVICRQFSTMIDAGISLIACLNILIDQTYNSKIKTAFKDIYLKVQQGETLSRAMGSHPKIFPEIMVSMIEAGEVGGVLDDILNRLAIHFEKEHKMNEKLKSAMTYPLLVISLAVLAVIFILTFVLPTFVQLFISLKAELPLPTRILLSISGILQNYWPCLLVVLGIAGYGFAALARIPQGEMLISQIILRMPVFGMLWRKVAIARFSRTLGTLIRGGIPILIALETVRNTTANIGMTTALTTAQASVRKGLGLATPLSKSKIFTPMVIQMVAIGEASGELDKMLDKVADFYESDVDHLVNRLGSLIEPILISVLGAIIGFIIISVLLPMFDLISNVRNAI